MISVGLSENNILPYLAQVNSTRQLVPLVVACINSPDNVTISGDDTQVDLLKTLLDKDSIFVRKLQVNVAYHSPQMNGVAADYLASISTLEPGDQRQVKTIMISSITGQKVSTTDLQEDQYWVKNLISPVNYSGALMYMCSSAGVERSQKLRSSSAIQITDLLEVGPHSALRGPTKSILKGMHSTISYSSAMMRSVSAKEFLLATLGHLHCHGYPIDMFEVNGFSEKNTNLQMSLPNLPQYPFDHSRSYWQEGRMSKGRRFRKYPRLDLLGAPVDDWNPLEAKWRNVLRLSESSWIGDHMVREDPDYSL
jgi:acyl transferase domain-containing protein